MNSTILIVEDNLDIQQILTTALNSFGYRTNCVSTGGEAIEAVAILSPDLVLLDLQLPDTSGFSVCEEIRNTSNVPIIIVSCLDDGSDIIKGLELGADDYVTKPFDLHQLVARVRSNLRRVTSFSQEIFSTNSTNDKPADNFQLGPITFHFQQQRITINGQYVPLSIKEFLILSILAKYPGTTFNANRLYNMIWGEDSLGETRTIKVHISKLRKKLDSYAKDEIYIETVRGLGYKLVT